MVVSLASSISSRASSFTYYFSQADVRSVSWNRFLVTHTSGPGQCWVPLEMRVPGPQEVLSLHITKHCLLCRTSQLRTCVQTDPLPSSHRETSGKGPEHLIPMILQCQAPSLPRRLMGRGNPGQWLQRTPGPVPQTFQPVPR